MVKLKIGNLEYNVIRFSHRFNFNDNNEPEQIYVELTSFNNSMVEDIEEAFEGSAEVVSGDIDYTFEGYILDSIDYTVDDNGERTSLFFKK